MYSVIRFLEKDEHLCLDEVAHMLKKEFVGLNPSRDLGVLNRISCSISSAATWLEQRQAIMHFVKQASETLVFCRAMQVNVEVDLAVEPEDYKHRLITECSLDNESLRLLVEKGISFVISIYGSIY